MRQFSGILVGARTIGLCTLSRNQYMCNGLNTLEVGISDFCMFCTGLGLIFLCKSPIKVADVAKLDGFLDEEATSFSGVFFIAMTRRRPLPSATAGVKEMECIGCSTSLDLCGIGLDI